MAQPDNQADPLENVESIEITLRKREGATDAAKYLEAESVVFTRGNTNYFKTTASSATNCCHCDR